MRFIKILKEGWCCLSAMTLIACSLSNTASRSTTQDLKLQDEKVTKLQRFVDMSLGDGEIKIQFINEQVGWIAQYEKLWRTTNGGESWSLIYSVVDSEAGATIDEIHFIDSQTGWIYAAAVGLLKTEDGGSSWAKQRDPIPNGAIYGLIIFKNGTEGWVGGVVLQPPPLKYADQVLREDSHTVIAHTKDGGKTWRQQFMPLTRGIGDFYFRTEDHGWALGSGLFHLKKKTNRWEKVDFNIGRCTDQERQQSASRKVLWHEPMAIYFLDLEQGWLSFKDGHIAKTTDGGKTWCDVFNPREIWPNPEGDTYFWRFHFIDPMKGWAVGHYSLYKTDNGGATWKRIDVDARFQDLYFVNNRRGWAVAKEGIYNIIP